MSKPSYLADNPWVDLLKQRGKDSGQPEPAAAKPTVPDSQKTRTQHAQPISASKKPRRGPRLLKAALRAYELSLQHFNNQEIGESLGVSARQVYNYVKRAQGFLGVPPGLRHSALAETLLAIKIGWREFYLSTDPRLKLLWHQEALRTMIHRDKLLGLCDGTVLREEIKT